MCGFKEFLGVIWSICLQYKCFDSISPKFQGLCQDWSSQTDECIRGRTCHGLQGLHKGGIQALLALLLALPRSIYLPGKKTGFCTFLWRSKKLIKTNQQIQQLKWKLCVRFWKDMMQTISCHSPLSFFVTVFCMLQCTLLWYTSKLLES